MTTETTTEITSNDGIRDDDIRALAYEAAEAGDFSQVAICYRALGEEHETAQADPCLTSEDARAECERVIRETRRRAAE